MMILSVLWWWGLNVVVVGAFECRCQQTAVLLRFCCLIARVKSRMQAFMLTTCTSNLIINTSTILALNSTFFDLWCLFVSNYSCSSNARCWWWIVNDPHKHRTNALTTVSSIFVLEVEFRMAYSLEMNLQWFKATTRSHLCSLRLPLHSDTTNKCKRVRTINHKK